MRKWAFLLAGVGAAAGAEAVDPGRFEKQTVVAGLRDVTQFAFAPDGRIVLLELAGAVKVFDPGARTTVTAGSVNALVGGDAGALGLALARDFAETGHVFVYYTPDGMSRRMRLERLTLRDRSVDPSPTKVVLEIPMDPDRTSSHCGGGLWMHTDGTLVIGTGDNNPAQDLPAVHPEEEKRDSRRTAANSRDLRGKVLRIVPQPDGTYTIPPGNLFADPAVGRPEIFAFGVRNAFRVSVDPATGWIAWGDVGGNVRTSFGLGPEGYDEIHVAREPGFFGWPFCAGPNDPWRPFEAGTNRPAGPPFDPARLVNDSPRNTGARELPPAQPAPIYYSSTVSPEWPFLGAGGRSVTGGVFFRSASDSPLRLPDSFDGAYFFGEWMRNWLAVARFDGDGKLVSLERFLPDMTFAKPADFKVGPDGALYLAEMGDRWTGNTDSRIARIVYRRGNRAPVARASASVESGAVPLTVTFRAEGSLDPDPGDSLTYRWEFGDGAAADGPEATHTFAGPGAYSATLTVTDPHGLSATATVAIAAGNAAPVVRLEEPADGAFVEPGRPVRWRVSAADAEDGDLPAAKVLVQLEERNRLAADDDPEAWPGLSLMRRTTCFACHSATEPSAGPPYAEIARRYASDPAARPVLANRILTGGSGSWGELPMPPHPQHTLEETSQMVEWILSLAGKSIRTLPPGSDGEFTVGEREQSWNAPSNGVFVLTASAVDNGAPGLPPQRGTASAVLRTRRQRACFFDRASNAVAQDNLEQGGLVARIHAPGGWISFDRVRLDDVGGLRLRCWPQGPGEMEASVRTGAGNEVLGRAALTPGEPAGRPATVDLAFDSAATGLQDVRIVLNGPDGAFLDVREVEFLPR